jgi:hypothetical protein
VEIPVKLHAHSERKPNGIPGRPGHHLRVASWQLSCAKVFGLVKRKVPGAQLRELVPLAEQGIREKGGSPYPSLSSGVTPERSERSGLGGRVFKRTAPPDSFFVGAL